MSTNGSQLYRQLGWWTSFSHQTNLISSVFSIATNGVSFPFSTLMISLKIHNWSACGENLESPRKIFCALALIWTETGISFRKDNHNQMHAKRWRLCVPRARSQAYVRAHCDCSKPCWLLVTSFLWTVHCTIVQSSWDHEGRMILGCWHSSR